METVLPAPPAPEVLVEPDPVLLEAARLLREGWAQGALKIKPHFLLRLLGARPRYCIAGALIAATGRDPDRDVPYGLSRFAVMLGFINLQAAARWNDASYRTPEEVVERVERAAYGL